MPASLILENVPILSIITPCYNEEESINRSLITLSEVLKGLIKSSKVNRDSFILVVDDGSNDNSLDLLKLVSSTLESNIIIVELAINSGHQKALLCGLEYCRNKVDITITIDFDLQDDVNAIEKMVDKNKMGSEVVLGVRGKRDIDTRFKRISASTYYKIARRLGVGIIPQHADFRLASNKQIVELMKYRDSDLYLREIIPRLSKHVGFVYYDRKSRVFGESKYTLLKMLQLARKSIFSKPNALLTCTIVAISLSLCLFLLLATWVLLLLLFGVSVPGWASIVLTILLTSLVQLFIQYFIVEHLVIMGKDVKRRPPYSIESTYKNKSPLN